MRRIMKRLLSLVLCLTTIFSMTCSVYAEGDPNISGGSGTANDASSKYDACWYTYPGTGETDSGIRITVVSNDGKEIVGSVDWTNHTPLQLAKSAGHSAVNWQTMIWYGGNKLTYQKAMSLPTKRQGYEFIIPENLGLSKLPTIIPSSGKANIASIKQYFTKNNVQKEIALQLDMEYEELISGKYKLLLEPVIYVRYKEIGLGLTATEAALANTATRSDGGGFSLTACLTSATHQQLPNAMFLEVDDPQLGLSAPPASVNTSGKHTGTAGKADMINYLGVGIVSFRSPYQYTVKVRINGVIDETLTQVFPAKKGDVIQEEDVDTSKVPEGAVITDISPVPLPVQEDPTKNIIIIDCEMEATKYTVKVVIDDVERPDLERTYDIEVGATITRDMVDTSIVPEGAIILDITPIPLVTQKDPAENIIVIVASTKQVTYKVFYYLDNVLKDSITLTGTKGETIGAVPINHYSGYVHQKTVGLPLTLVDSNGVVRVYYVKSISPMTVQDKVVLFTDEYKTQVTNKTYKSGYGFWSYYYVDVPSWLGQAIIEGRTTAEKDNPRWSVYGGCSASERSKVVDKYRNIQYTVTATWRDGLPLSNKSGTTVTRDMILEKSKSTSTRLCFKLPANPNSNIHASKAYVPVAWSDGAQWKVTCNFKATYEEYEWYTTPQQSSCPGHVLLFVIYFHKYTILNLHEQYVKKDINSTDYAAVTINGSMYEDDFTGGRT